MARSSFRVPAIWALAVAAFVAVPAAQAQRAPVAVGARAQFAENSFDAVRYFSGDGQKTLEFYGEVLGFGPARPVGGGSHYQLGTSQLRLAKAPPDAAFTRGAINDAAGVRLWTMWFGDEAALVQRFLDHGLPPPPIRDVEGTRSAMMTDPDGEWVQLMILRNASKEALEHLDVGIATNDLEKSRDFYRSFVGLEELRPMLDQTVGLTKYPFGHGRTTVTLWATRGRKPVNPRLAGIHFAVKSVAAVRALAEQRGLAIEQPRGEGLPGLVTTSVLDPDQVVNSFSEASQ